MLADGSEQDCALEFPDRPPWVLRCNGPFLAGLAWEGSDLFDCLVEFRRALAQQNARLLCMGAAVSVYPSAMSRQAGGRMAYRVRPGRPAAKEDIIDIFAPAPLEDIGSVEEQRRFFEQWLTSLKR